MGWGAMGWGEPDGGVCGGEGREGAKARMFVFRLYSFSQRT